MMPRPPRYIDSPLYRFFGACLIVVAAAFAVMWFFGLLAR
jgi:hypothetical protein